AVEGVLEDLAFPGAEGRHVPAGRAAGGKLDARVDEAHHLGGLIGDAAILLGGLAAHLPGSVDLVAEAPELDVVRLLPAVAAAEVGELGAGGMVAVFDQPAGLVRPARAKIDRQHRLDPGEPAP